MASSERRKNMPLDEAYVYFRRLQLKLERPALFKVCNAIKTIDLAMETNDYVPWNLSQKAWSKIRDEYFKILITSFSGYFLVYEGDYPAPLEAGNDWPEHGYVEFYPERILRRFDTYRAAFKNIETDVLTQLRWCFASDKQNIDPSVFASGFEIETELQLQTAEFLDKLYEICEEEASQGKKKAHRKWWQLYWEANSCADKKQRHELHKQMLSLQSVWGRPAQTV